MQQLLSLITATIASKPNYGTIERKFDYQN